MNYYSISVTLDPGEALADEVSSYQEHTPFAEGMCPRGDKSSFYYGKGNG